MIGNLKGVIYEIDEDHCLVDVHGVGYVADLLGTDACSPARDLASRSNCSSRPMSAKT